ncbi:MAG TPA: DUF308 domain-containing protein [Bacteroidales bacterium]|nr:DUF308 domain-containing protein [Bacteroidales bacterium]
MKKSMQKNWWIMTINGVLAIVIGAVALFDSESLLISLSVYFGLLVLISGLMLLLGAYDHRKKQKKYEMLLIEGVVMSILGLIIMIFPLETLKIFLILIGVWALLTGLVKIYLAASIGSGFAYRNVMLISGVLLSLIGLGLLIDPTWVASNLLIVFGLIFIVIGILTIFFSVMIKNLKS